MGIDIVIPLSDFPSVMEADSVLNPNDTWRSIAPKKIAYMYNKTTYSYTREHECQPSPEEPGAYLYPPNVLEENPLDVCGELGEKEEYFYNTNTKTWDKRIDMFLFPLYEKSSGNLATNPLRENMDKYTMIKPISKFSRWDDNSNTWVVDVNSAKESLLGSMLSIEAELRSEKIELNGKEYNGVSDLQSYGETYNSLITDDQEGVILTDDGVVTISKKDLKDLILACSNRKTDFLKTKAYFNTELNNSSTLDTLYDVIELKPLEDSKNKYGIAIDNEVALYVAKKLALTLNEDRDDTSTYEVPVSNPSMELKPSEVVINNTGIRLIPKAESDNLVLDSDENNSDVEVEEVKGEDDGV